MLFTCRQVNKPFWNHDNHCEWGLGWKSLGKVGLKGSRTTQTHFCSTHRSKPRVWHSRYRNFVSWRTLYVSQAGLELTIILLPQPLRSWGYSHMPPPWLKNLKEILWCAGQFVTAGTYVRTTIWKEWMFVWAHDVRGHSPWDRYHGWTTLFTLR